MAGLFVTFEGGEGCGKSTLVNLVYDTLKEKNYKVMKTREPGGSLISEQIREILLSPDNYNMTAETEALLYAASRAQHTREKIIPALLNENIVLCDRYLSSSLAYQGWARKLGVEEVTKINDFALQGFRPNLEFYIDTPKEERMNRLVKRRHLDRIEVEGNDFHSKVDEYFEESNKQMNRIILDGTKTPQELCTDVINVINAYNSLVERTLLSANAEEKELSPGIKIYKILNIEGIGTVKFTINTNFWNTKGKCLERD